MDYHFICSEERVSSMTKEQPGDIFHPHFLEGHSTYFDVFVSKSLAPGTANHSSVTAGSAGLLGQAMKDARHVEKAGGIFVQ